MSFTFYRKMTLATLATALSICGCKASTSPTSTSESPSPSDTPVAATGTLNLDPCDSTYTGESNCSAAVSTSLDTTVANIEAVSKVYLPGSLALDPPALRLNDEGGEGGDENPCAGKTFDTCQPNLLLAYIKIGKMPFDMATQLIASTKPLIVKQLADKNLVGTITSTKEDEPEKIEFNIVTSTNFSLRVIDHGMGIYLSLADTNHIDLKVRMTAASAEAPSSGASSVEGKIEFTDSLNWKVDNKYIVDTCPTQGQGPDVVIVKMNRTAGIWQGKAMLHDVGESICKSKDHAGQAGWYTDFVGDDSATTEAVYFIPLSVNPVTVNNLETYNLANLCTNIPQHQFCGGDHGNNGGQTLALTGPTSEQCMKCGPEGEWHQIQELCIGVTQEACMDVGGGQNNPDNQNESQNDGQNGGQSGDSFFTASSEFVNPFCLKNGNDPIWKRTCDSSIVEISKPTFSDKSLWVHPKTGLRDASICFPSSLSKLDVCAKEL